VADLSKVLDFSLASNQTKTRVIAYTSGAGATSFTFKADVDYFFIQGYSASGTEVCINTFGLTTVPALGTKATWESGILYLTSTTTAASTPLQHTPIPVDTIITTAIGGASAPAMFVLEYA